MDASTETMEAPAVGEGEPTTVIEPKTEAAEAAPIVYHVEAMAIELDEADQRALKEMHDGEAAVRNFVSMVQQQGQGQLAQMQAKGREVWTAIAEKHDLDLDKIDYTLSNDGKTLIPVRAKLGG